MKKVIIKSLYIENFKGIKKLELSFDDVASYLRGENGTGKSTIDDVINYLFRGKNANGSADTDFSIKPLDSNGNEIHRLETVVMAKIHTDGIDRELKKVYKEKWTTKNGTDEQVFSGNTVDYYVDTIKQKTKKSYDEAVDTILGVDQKNFSMISNPRYFMSQIAWTEKRKVLCDMAGVISYEDIIKETQFKDLREHLDLNKHSVEQFKTHCKAQITGIKEKKEEIPIQLKVLDEQDADIIMIPFRTVEEKISSNESSIERIKEKFITLTDKTAEDTIKLEYSEKITKIQNDSAELRIKRNKILEQKESTINESSVELREKLKLKNSDLDYSVNTIVQIERGRDSILNENAKDEIELNSLIIKRDDMRKQFAALGQSVFTFNHDSSCPTCNREYDALHIGSARYNAEKEFNERIESQKTAIRNVGATINESIAKIENDIATRNNQADEIWKSVVSQQTIVSDIKKEIEIIEYELKNKKADTSKFDNEISNINTEIEELDKSIQYLEAEKLTKIKSLGNDSIDIARHELKESIESITKENELLREKLSLRGQLKNNAIKRQKYLDTEKELNSLFEHWSKLEFLTTQLIKAYMTKVEENVNSLFTTVKFKLFEEQQNGGEREVCIPTVLGVPDGDLNTAKYINAGIDIINALSKHFGVCAPIVIDNRESITDIITTESQIINLIKDSSYPSLTQTEK